MADLERIINHTTALLNAYLRLPSGVPVYGPQVGDSARSNLEIAETCLQAAIKTAQAICESDSHPFRIDFLDDIALAHGEPVPFHYGDTSVPSITPFAGATFTMRGVRKAFDRIESYRLNRNGAYSSVNHNAAGTGNTASPLAGFYDIVNGVFYFTGHQATMKLADFDRDDVIEKLPDAVEPTVIKLACGMSAKEGDTSDGLFQLWLSHGMNDLSELKTGATAFQPIDEAIAARGDRVA
jgi:hypothetical protein